MKKFQLTKKDEDLVLTAHLEDNADQQSDESRTVEHVVRNFFSQYTDISDIEEAQFLTDRSENFESNEERVSMLHLEGMWVVVTHHHHSAQMFIRESLAVRANSDVNHRIISFDTYDE